MSKGSPQSKRAARQIALLRHGTSDHYVDSALYDFEYKDRDCDVVWYRKQLGPGPTQVLELGAGSGRVTLPLLGDGHTVTALDRMGTMLDGLRRKLGEQIESGSLARDVGERLEICLGDMRSLAFADGSFDWVIAPFNTLMHLYTNEDLEACFSEVARVLRPGGRFALDVLLPDFDWLTWDPVERHSVTPFVDPTSGQKMIYSTNHTYDYETQVCHVRLYYDPKPPRGQAFAPAKSRGQIVHLAHRQIFPEELRLLLRVCGFEVERLTGDFDGGPLAIEAESQSCVCRKR